MEPVGNTTLRMAGDLEPFPVKGVLEPVEEGLVPFPLPSFIPAASLAEHNLASAFARAEKVSVGQYSIQFS